VATERFNGVLIKPGEEFSFVKILGEVDAEHGYLPELVIKNNKTEPEFGGGICLE
jgi:vancomycin resistance protein VanW